MTLDGFIYFLKKRAIYMIVGAIVFGFLFSYFAGQHADNKRQKELMARLDQKVELILANDNANTLRLESISQVTNEDLELAICVLAILAGPERFPGADPNRCIPIIAGANNRDGTFSSDRADQLLRQAQEQTQQNKSESGQSDDQPGVVGGIIQGADTILGNILGGKR